MFAAKYIRFEGNLGPRMVVFTGTLEHNRVARALQTEFPDLEPESAGFISVSDFGAGPEYQCFGNSVTLNMKADPKDSILAKKLLAED